MPEAASKPPARKRKRTRTSPFGAPGRVNHDSEPFYASRLYTGLRGEAGNDHPASEGRTPCASAEADGRRRTASAPATVDTIFCKSSEQMSELPDKSVHLMVTSPPYNVGKEYDQDLTLEEYLALLQRVWREVKRVLVDGGRMCINVANLGRKPYLPLHAYILQGALALGFMMRGEIIWNKASSASPSTAWGSWQSATNPTLRDVHEYILVFSKGSFRRKKPAGRDNTIGRDEFLEATKSVWAFPTETARKVGHPAPFPVELPRRLIQLYTFAGELVLDPFMGSGQTALAALRSGRHFVGYETEPEYVRLAQERIEQDEREGRWLRAAGQ
jgi:DNA modification methylase